MAKAIQVSELVAGYFHKGTLLAGGTATFLLPGTATPKSIWLDPDKLTPAANPFPLNARGAAQVFADGVYDIEIRDPAGVLIDLWEDFAFFDNKDTLGSDANNLYRQAWKIGLHPSFGSAPDEQDFTAGAIATEDGAYSMEFAATTVKADGTGLGKLDDGVFAADTQYQAWGLGRSSVATAGVIPDTDTTIVLSTNTTLAPVLANVGAGFNVGRRLCSPPRTKTLSPTFIKYNAELYGAMGLRFRFREDTIGNPPYRVLTAGTSTTPIIVSVAGVVPFSAQAFHLRAKLETTNAVQGRAFLKGPGEVTALVGDHTEDLFTSSDGVTLFSADRQGYWLIIDKGASLAFVYSVDSVNVFLECDVNGYIDNLLKGL
jgi:hypothetical protein